MYFYLACYNTAKDDSERAIENLKTAYNYGFNRPNWIEWIETEKSLDILRGNEEYIALIKKMKENLNSLN